MILSEKVDFSEKNLHHIQCIKYVYIFSYPVIAVGLAGGEPALEVFARIWTIFSWNNVDFYPYV
jgi:hypothetical protein